MAESNYEAIVIGGGPGGYACAIRLGQLGVKTLCVEKESMGGVCLNWGCIPSKALIAAANLVDKIKRAETMGIAVSGLSVDVEKMQAWKDGIVKKLTSGVSSLVKGNGADIVMGTAKVASPTSVEVTAADGKKSIYNASKGIVVATGTHVIQIPGFEPDGKTVITAREAVSLKSAPKSMLIVGGGVIGLELGMVYQKLGTEITVVEMMDSLLPGVDADLVRVVQKHLKKAGANILLKSKASGMKKTKSGATVTVETDGKSQDIDAEVVLMAVGFKPNANGIGLEEAGVKLDDRGHVIVDDRFRTNVSTVFAIGDVCGPPYLAHKANKEGEITAEVIAGHKSERDWRGMPAAIFTHPEIATVGMTETEAKAQGKKVKIGKFPFAASGRAMAVSETDGFVKVIMDEADHQLLGVGIVGPEASDLISEAALALEMTAYVEDVALTIHPHPTLGEGVMEAVQARDRRSGSHHEQVVTGARTFHVYRLGEMAYHNAHDLQQRLLEARKADDIPDTVLLLSHPPTITLGRSAKPEHLLKSPSELAGSAIAIHEVGRGGDVTYHGPGQLVCYPIINLTPDRKDVRKYVWSLEETMIRVCADYGLKARRVAGLNGTWLGDRKVGAVGVRISKWVTMHGFALNVNTDLSQFEAIVPCGIHDKGVISLERELGRNIDMAKVTARAAEHFAAQYDAEIVWHEGAPKI